MNHRLLPLIAVCATLFAAAAAAQNFPSKPIRLIVPFAPGGSSDIVARTLAQRAAEPLGQQIIVDNRGGAGGAIGAEIVARAPADGYTLLLANPGPNAINPALNPKINYDPIKDFSAVTLAAASPQVLVVHPSMPVKSVREFIALARSRPGQINYGSSGTGAITHLAMEFFKGRTKTDMVHIPYKGASVALAEILGGQVSAMFAALGSIQAQLAGNRLRPIGIAAREQTPLLPGVPTIIEGGVPDFEVINWFGIVAPGNTPKPVIDRLYQAMSRAVLAPEMKERFTGMGFIPRGSTPEEMDKHIRAELERWRSVIKSQNIKPE